MPADRARLEEACFTVALDPDVLDRPWAELSGGERQRAALVVATNLCPQPSVLLLDEPTSALDATTTAAVEQYLLQTGMAIIWVTHDESQAQRVGHRQLYLSKRMGKGQMYMGSPGSDLSEDGSMTSNQSFTF